MSSDEFVELNYHLGMFGIYKQMNYIIRDIDE